MLQVIASGNIGKDAELRAAGRDQVCAFSVACSKKVKGEEKTVWIGCSLWGKRGETLVKHLTKGTRVVVTGELSSREHNGKTYLECRVAEIDFSGGTSRGSKSGPPDDDDGRGPRTGFGGGGSSRGDYSDTDYGPKPDDGEIPF